MRRIHRYPLPVLALGALITMALVGIAVGAIPGGDGVISACYQKPGLLKNPGAVRVIDREAGQNCRSDETAIAWDRTDRVHQARVSESGALAGGDAASAGHEPGGGAQIAHYVVRFPFDLTNDCAATATPRFVGPRPGQGGGGDPLVLVEASLNAQDDLVRVRPRSVSSGNDVQTSFELMVAC